jgi:hypothetical protein
MYNNSFILFSNYIFTQKMLSSNVFMYAALFTHTHTHTQPCMSSVPNIAINTTQEVGIHYQVSFFHFLKINLHLIKMHIFPRSVAV